MQTVWFLRKKNNLPTFLFSNIYSTGNMQITNNILIRLQICLFRVFSDSIVGRDKMKKKTKRRRRRRKKKENSMHAAAALFFQLFRLLLEQWKGQIHVECVWVSSPHILTYESVGQRHSPAEIVWFFFFFLHCFLPKPFAC